MYYISNILYDEAVTFYKNDPSPLMSNGRFQIKHV